MRSGHLFLFVLSVTALALIPGMALADEDHSMHGASGPANPLKKTAMLFLDASGGLGTTAGEAGAVPAGANTPGGQPAPVAWTIQATKNSTIGSSPFIEFYVRVDQPTVIPSGPLGGPQGAAFHLQLTRNGEAVPGAESLVTASSTLWLPAAEPVRYKVFIPQPDNFTLAPGDVLGLEILFYGLNPDGLSAISYIVGGETGAHLVFTLQYASLAEVLIPAEVGPWPMAPLEGFDFEAAAKANPRAKVVTLRAHQYDFEGAPVIVQNDTEVILQMYVDETLSTDPAGHEAHAHAAPEGLAWDQNYATSKHGFSLLALKPGLNTVLFDNIVVTMRFTAEKPGNYTFLCTVFCGSGHGGMVNRLEVQGPVTATPESPSSTDGSVKGTSGDKTTPGPELAGVLAAAAVVALVARRRR